MDPFPNNLPLDERTVKTNWYFELGIWNLRLVEFSYVIYLYQAFHDSDNLMGAMLCLPCLICCAMSEIKVTILRRKQDVLLDIFKFLYKSWPTTEVDQEYFGLASVMRMTRRDSVAMSICFTIFIWSFNLFPLLEATVLFLEYGQNFTYPLPYPVVVPFRTDRPLALYMFMNVELYFAGYVVAQYFIGSDTLLFAIINQVCMQFDYLSKRVRNNLPKGNRDDKDFWKEIVQQHNQALLACDNINNIFSDSMFLNFLASAGIICLVAFRATLAGLQVSGDLIKLILYLVAMVNQIFILSSFGDRLMRSSQGISQSPFEHNWYDASTSYKKSMILVMQRADKPALLRASYFSVVSYQSFKVIMTSSYQLFAVLHTNYSKKNRSGRN